MNNRRNLIEKVLLLLILREEAEPRYVILKDGTVKKFYKIIIRK
jgi:hypothetical protein